MKVAFFGLPLAALLLRQDGHEIVLAVSPRREAVGNRRAKRALGDAFVIHGAVDEALTRRVVASGADLLVSWFWTTRLPMSLIEACPLGGLGVHPSLLPRHRGPDPYFWAIERGDTVTGVTAHRLAAEYDTGAILARRELAILPTWNAWQLAKALDRPSLALLRHVVGEIAAGRPPASQPQDEALATPAPEPDEDLCALRLSGSTEAILRRIRALAPAPGASLDIGETTVVVTRAERVEHLAGLAPGEALFVDGRVVVRTGDGAIALLDAAREDGCSLAALFA